MDTLGKMIGVVTHNFSTKDKHEVSTKIAIRFDFSTATDADIRAWLVANRTISIQRPLAKLTATEITELNNSVVIAQDSGKKMRSESEIKNDMMAAAKANPEMFKKMLEELEAEASEMSEEELEE